MPRERRTFANVPKRFTDQPELLDAILEARTVQMNTEDTAAAIDWLVANHPISRYSATRALEDQTFRYRALYPDGHPELEAYKAEQRARGRRSYNLKKIRPQVIDRDDSRCRRCKKRVQGEDATVDHIDPEGPETLENLQLLCRSCNSTKGRQTWEEFEAQQVAWAAHVEKQQNERPDFKCNRTGLSVRGRTWKAAGCISSARCRRRVECTNGQKVTRRKKAGATAKTGSDQS